MELKGDKYLLYDHPYQVNFKFVVKRILSFILNWLLKLFFLFVKKDTRTCKYKLSVCSIFKNESESLMEWIEYHMVAGVEHFYLYNNNSEDDYKTILRPYIEEGIVTLYDWPEYPGQASAYNHCWDNFRSDSQWIAFIDLDEYICPKYDENIPLLLDRYSKYPILVIYWLFFGTSGELSRNRNKCLIEQLTSCYEKPVNIGKCIINTRWDILPFSKKLIHLQYARVRGVLIPPINLQRNFIIFDIHRITTHNLPMQLNHYWSRTYNQYLSKQNRGGGMSGQWITSSIFWRNEIFNVSKDYTIFRFLLKLKIVLQKRINHNNESHSN